MKTRILVVDDEDFQRDLLKKLLSKVGYEVETASYLSLIGCDAGRNLTTGGTNTLIGYQAGYDMTNAGAGVLYLLLSIKHQDFTHLASRTQERS